MADHRSLYRVTQEPITPGQLHDVVRASHHGAVVTFCGVVRDNSAGQRTQYLVYEAYEAMAERELARIGAEVRRRWPVVDIAMVHRVGRLEIGEVSVLIAVASPHRAEAFEACRHAIDRLKESVPIWKKEVSADGQVWVEGPVAREDAR
ncbi:MAG: molybdenum cofactor biosynthesis protein MoaE [Candidatus Latescibacterota bacterium]